MDTLIQRIGWQVPKKRTLLKLCTAICLINILLVGVLAGAGVLRTAERGDVTYTRVERMDEMSFTIPADSPDHFAVEQPTDADAFYNMVVRVRNGGPMYNPGGGNDIQDFHYFSLVYLLYWPLAQFGYLAFKVFWLAVSVAAVIGGNALLLRAESSHYV